VKEPVVKRKNTPLEAAKTARQSRGNKEKSFESSAYYCLLTPWEDTIEAMGETDLAKIELWETLQDEGKMEDEVEPEVTEMTCWRDKTWAACKKNRNSIMPKQQVGWLRRIAWSVVLKALQQC